MIEAAREFTARTVNAALTALYWNIGSRIRREILKEKRAEYGKRIAQTLSAQLVPEYGPGYSEKVLRHMIRFAETFPDHKIVSSLGRQLSWTHFRNVIYLRDPLQRDFYAEMCRVERWSVRILRSKIDGMLYERTALSRKPQKLIARDIRKLREKDELIAASVGGR